MIQAFALILVVASADGSEVHQRQLGVYDDKFVCQQAANQVPDMVGDEVSPTARVSAICVPHK